jgi:hypothetical protein
MRSVTPRMPASYQLISTFYGSAAIRCRLKAGAMVVADYFHHLDFLLEICPRSNNKVVFFIFPLFIIVFIFYAITVLVLNMRFGLKPNYIYGIINNKEFPNLASKISSPII